MRPNWLFLRMGGRRQGQGRGGCRQGQGAADAGKGRGRRMDIKKMKEPFAFRGMACYISGNIYDVRTDAARPGLVSELVFNIT